MEIEYKDVSFGVSKVYEDQFAVQTRVDASERGGVSKALSVEAEAKVTGVELLPGEAKISGKVNYRLLYLDGQEKLCGLDYFKDFEYDLMGEEIRANDRCELDLSVIEASSGVEGDGLILSSVVCAYLRSFGEKEERAVAAVKGGEVKEETKPTQRLETKRVASIELEKEEEAGTNVKKIVLFDATAAVKNAEITGGTAQISGEAKANVVYVTEDGDAEERSFSFPFEREEAISADKACFDLSVMNARVVLSGDDENATIGIEIVLSLAVSEFADGEVTVLTDVFSSESETTETRTEVGTEPFLAQKFFIAPFSGAIEAENVRHILSVRPGGVAVANVATSENGVKVEGVASFTAVYETEEGYASAERELPFSFELPFIGAENGMSAEAFVRILSVSHAIAAGGVRVNAEASVSISIFGKENISFLSDITEGDAREESEAGVTVYFANVGEDIWSIAKAMQCAPSLLLKTNPFLASPLEEAKKVLLFRGK